MQNRRAYTASQSGFTLTELMIVVVVLGIIVAIAYPSYVRQAQKAGRSDATSALLAIAAAQEKEFLKNNAFTASLAELGITETDANKYTLTLTADNGGFLATATAGTVDNVSQVGDTNCKVFTLDETGARLSTDGTSPTTGCW